MSLLCNISRVLDGKECADVQADLCDMVVAEFTVPRSTNSALRTVLLCESPHTEEICHGHMLAGRTGEKVTAVLQQTPCVPAIVGQGAIGRLLRGGTTQHAVLDSLGLMNVSTLPLQRAPYCPYVRQDDDYKRLLCAFEKMRGRVQVRKHGLSFRSSANSDQRLITMMQQLRDIMLQDLDRRLCLLPQYALVIPCGHFARNFLRRAERGSRRQWSDPLRTGLESLPHPSRWPRRGTFDSLPCCLRTLLRLIHHRAGH